MKFVISANYLFILYFLFLASLLLLFYCFKYFSSIFLIKADATADAVQLKVTLLSSNYAIHKLCAQNTRNLFVSGK